MQNSIEGSGRLFLVLPDTTQKTSGADSHRFFALLSSLMPNVQSLEEKELDKIISTLSDPGIMDIVDGALAHIDCANLSGETFKTLLEGFITGLPSELAIAIGKWIDTLGIEGITDSNILLKIFILILSVVMMILKAQMRLLEAITGQSAEIQLDF